MHKILFLLLLLASNFASAQHDSLLAFLKASYEQEKSWQSGEIEITNYHMDGDSITSSKSSKLTFFKQADNTPFFLLEDSDEGVYFSNDNKIEFAFREHRRQWFDLRFPKAYTSRFNAAFDQLAINPYLESDNEQAYVWVQNLDHNGRDSMIEWNPQTRVMKIKTQYMLANGMTNIFVWSYTFDSEKRLIHSGLVQELSVKDSIIYMPSTRHRSFNYSHINQVPYISIIQKIKNLQSLPLQTVFSPETMEIDSSPKIGEQFPNLVLMDVMGDQTHLAEIYGPKVLIYFEGGPTPFDSLFTFVDSLEDLFPDITFMLITRHNIDELYFYKRDHPSIKSFYLASRVEGLYLNGWPVWIALDPQNKFLAENHGYQSIRKNEFKQWIKGLYEVH